MTDRYTLGQLARLAETDLVRRDVERFPKHQDDDLTVVAVRINPHDTIGTAWI